MRANRKLAGGALAVNLISGVLGVMYLIHLGAGRLDPTQSVLPEVMPALAGLAAIMTVSTLVMMIALPKRK